MAEAILCDDFPTLNVDVGFLNSINMLCSTFGCKNA
jgi:hypothetical protein